MTTTATSLVALFTANSKAVDSSHRLAKFTWKAKKDKAGVLQKKLAPDLCCNIPSVTLTCSNPLLNELATAAFQDMQDDVIREEIERQLFAGISISDLAPVNLDTVSAEAISTAFSTKASGERLTRAMLELWFDTELYAPVYLAFATKYGFDKDKVPDDVSDKKIESVCASAKDLLAGFSAPKPPHVTPATLEQLTKLVNLIVDTSTDPVTKKMAAKLSALTKPVKPLEMLDTL